MQLADVGCEGVQLIAAGTAEEWDVKVCSRLQLAEEWDVKVCSQLQLAEEWDVKVCSQLQLALRRNGM